VSSVGHLYALPEEAVTLSEHLPTAPIDPVKVADTRATWRWAKKKKGKMH
jgi:hypothetical protein